ncbi:MAG: efflux RND transporter periplasmic adaptor subunit [Cyclobacteriaceae bacterium]|nr:efflux RND transporter periplasmic adaptor subunit [Cyclobacteriaceae bacterium]
MRKKIISAVVVLAVIVLLALPKLNLWSNGSEGPKNPAAAAARRGPSVVPVEALVLNPTRLDNVVVVTGSVQPNESLELKSETAGKITNIYFKEGKAVKKGELLVRVNDEEIRATLEKQKYNRKLNQDIEFRQRKLLEKEAISQEEYDNALNKLNTTKADIAVLEAQLDKTMIRAPFDGVIGLRYVSEGALISTSTAIANLYNVSPAKIEFAIPGRYSTQVKSGQKIKFTVESDTINYEGEVYALEPQIDANTRTLTIRALAENTKGMLLPGQFVKVELVLGTTNNAILVPTEAVVPELNGHKVFVAKNGKAMEVPVQTGIRNNTNLEIISGLHPQDTLITTGILQLRNGLDIQITKMN